MLKKHSITIMGHKTSISLEPEFWAELKIIAENNNKNIAEIISEIDSCATDSNLSSKIRVFVLKNLKK